MVNYPRLPRLEPEPRLELRVKTPLYDGISHKRIEIVYWRRRAAGVCQWDGVVSAVYIVSP